MSTPTVKKKTVARTVFTDADIVRTLNLGNGYVVVKFRDRKTDKVGTTTETTSPVALLDNMFPSIEKYKVRKLFEREAAKDAPLATEPLAPAASIAEKRENALFTAKLDRQSMRSRQQHLDEGGLLTSADICQRLAITRQALSKAVKSHRIFFVDGPSNSQLYPAFFATTADERRLLEAISQRLGDLPGPSKWDFFLTPKLSLGGRTPISALETGDLHRVLAAAEAFRGR